MMYEYVERGGRLLTVRDLAIRWRLTTTTIYRLLREGKIPFGVKIGHARRWPLLEIESYERMNMLNVKREVPTSSKEE